MRIKSIRPAGVEPVYNLEVAQTHSFAVENGVIVHNCADETRYFCMARPVSARILVPKPPKLYNPLDSDNHKETYGLGIYL